MSVTERFTEIATMKCLGALDGFLRRLFLIEASLEGLLGATVGAIVGVSLALLRAWLELGGVMWTAVAWLDLLSVLGLSLLAGVVLAVVAAIAPASVAARLVPMEAMRIE